MKLIFYFVAFASISVLGWQVSCDDGDPVQQLLSDTFAEALKDPDFNKWAFATSINVGSNEAVLIGLLSHLPKHLLAVLDEKITEEMKHRFVITLLKAIDERREWTKLAGIDSSFVGQGPVSFGFVPSFKTDL